MVDTQNIEKKIDELQRVRTTWAWTFNDAVSKLHEIDQEIIQLNASLQTARQESAAEKD